MRIFAAMAFLRADKKQSGIYLRIVESYKENGKPKHRALRSLGKLEDYPPNQLEAIAKKLLALSATILEYISPAIFPRGSALQLWVWSYLKEALGSVPYRYIYSTSKQQTTSSL